MRFKRSDRVGGVILKEISQMIMMGEIKDPRIGFTTLTRIELSDDIRNAKVFVSVMGGEKEKKNTMEALEKASGFIKWEIGKRLRLKHIPDIIFKLDTSMEHSEKIARLLKELKENEELRIKSEE